MTSPGSLGNHPAFQALKNRVDMLERRVNTAQVTANGASSAAAAGVTTSAKRFRIGVVSTPLILAGAQVTASVKWSTPITDNRGAPVDTYNVDASCTAFPSQSLIPTLTNQSSTGVTVSFTAPVLLAAGSIVVVLGIASVAAS